jgi:hypothetical protein
VYVLPDVLAVVGDDPALSQYTSLLRSWMDSGAHRVDRARTGHYSDQAAIALMDTWYPLVAKEVLEPRLGPLAGSIPTSPDDLPNQHHGSSYDNIGSYQWVTRDLESLLGKHISDPMSQQYCGKGDLTTCRDEIRQTLQQAVSTLASKQHTTDPTKWTYAKADDDIQFQYVGETVAPIDWQNRPTFQQVVG